MSRVAYGLIRTLFTGLGRLLFRFQVVGHERVPKEGGLLVAANHASYLDIPALGCGLPRRLAYLGRQDLFKIPGTKRILRWLGWIPLRQDRLDRNRFGTAIGLIQEGKAVAMYPEGSRSPDGRLRAGKPGIGVIVSETGCPVLPVYIDGTFGVLPRGASWPRLRAIRVVIGEPIDFSDDRQKYSGKEFYKHVSRIVMARIADLGQVAQPVQPFEGSKQE